MQILHVAAGATGGDGSVGSPFGTIEAAAAVATPGTAIRLGPGVHASDQFVSMLRGTAAAPIWIGGEPGQDRPILSGGGQALQLARPAYVVVHDLEIRNTTQNGINCDDGGDTANPDASRFVVFRKLNIHDVSGLTRFAISARIIARLGSFWPKKFASR